MARLAGSRSCPATKRTREDGGIAVAEFAITPDIQFLKDLALNPEEDSIWVVGLRARLAL